ncbi:MAG: leucyl-tRNA synthetase [Archaeoglobi archaeon]|nr:leucine--tRNA ligase [Candidatus Mnemosynella bozhongmuii]MDI3502285.1 leucyl-tRNA synthetase [Archaeoglobi archaeon]MDK2782142.1 leucyl-tRNA synthetase [Archaeoglobi archaeon]
MEEIDFHEIERKWQEKWFSEGIFNAEPEEREKFFITIPYPYLNGNLHVGHTRTFTIGDAIARWKRMLGFNVLYPMGFHVTGTPIVGLAELIAKRDEETLRVYNELHGIPMEELLQLTTPEKIVEYFSKCAEEDMRRIGYSIDWRRKFTTTDPHYQKFIEWQFRKLREKGYVSKGSHPVRWCPNDENPVEDHDILRGEEATIVDFVLIKFRMGDIILPCATLRPETVFGVTNLWVNPTATYVKAKVDGEIWIASEKAFWKLSFANRKIEELEKIKGEELLGKFVENPVTKDRVPILPANFVDPNSGTGVVMSVPAHAPYDYLALRDLGDEIKKYGMDELKLISLIDVPELGKYPAVKVVEELGVRDQNDEKAEEATKIVYRKEFHTGVLNEVTGKYAGTRVSEIKERLTEDLIREGVAEIFYDFSESPVICRCGTECVVKLVSDQWFLTYSNPEWKRKALECLGRMRIIPEEIRKEFENKIDWLRDKACARRKGLGTRLPWDREWLIESLADSTIYMAYYILAKYVKEIDAERLCDEFFDYIYLGKGDAKKVSEKTGISEELIERIRRDFEYWYPVDLRSSGKDLVPNHLLFFIFHHVAIFPEKHWPRGISINGYVSLEGKKMSKSKGPLMTMREAIRRFGADASRLYILGNSEHVKDADWRNAEVENTRKQLIRFYQLITEMSGGEIDESDHMDRWLRSMMQIRIKEVNEAMENVQTRRAVQNAFYQLLNDVRWYQRRTGRKIPEEIRDEWLKLLAPFIPHLCEELWHRYHDSFISLESYPQYDETKVDRASILSEELLKETYGDIQDILRVTEIRPRKIIIYVADEWKKEVYRRMLEAKNEGRIDIGAVIRSFRDSGVDMKRLSEFVKREAKRFLSMDEELLKIYLSEIDELELYRNSAKFLASEFECEVEVFSEGEAAYDPANKRSASRPMKPAIYIE